MVEPGSIGNMLLLEYNFGDFYPFETESEFASHSEIIINNI